MVYDSSSVEQPYAVALDRAEMVKVFAKLPSKFKIDVPLGATTLIGPTLRRSRGVNVYTP